MVSMVIFARIDININHHRNIQTNVLRLNYFIVDANMSGKRITEKRVFELKNNNAEDGEISNKHLDTATLTPYEGIYNVNIVYIICYTHNLDRKKMCICLIIRYFLSFRKTPNCY